MSFQLIERQDLEVQKWDNLVDETEGASVFTSSFYLDAVAENWCVLINTDYTAGLALPYTIRAKRKILYTPIFISYLEILGSAEMGQLREVILKKFKTIEVEFKQEVLGSASDIFVTQFLNVEKKRKGQVNRMINKSKRAGYEILETENWAAVFKILHAELNGKFSGMTEISLQRLKKAYSISQEKGLLRTFEIVEGNKGLGGVICIEKNGQLLYSKGACSIEVRNQGGMYAAMNAAIDFANKKNLTFDFGGSRVEGVRRFNHAFGGEDLEYFSYRIDKSPLWFRWVRHLKKRWGKKS